MVDYSSISPLLQVLYNDCETPGHLDENIETLKRKVDDVLTYRDLSTLIAALNNITIDECNYMCSKALVEIKVTFGILDVRAMLKADELNLEIITRNDIVVKHHTVRTKPENTREDDIWAYIIDYSVIHNSVHVFELAHLLGQFDKCIHIDILCVECHSIEMTNMILKWCRLTDDQKWDLLDGYGWWAPHKDISYYRHIFDVINYVVLCNKEEADYYQYDGNTNLVRTLNTMFEYGIIDVFKLLFDIFVQSKLYTKTLSFSNYLVTDQFDKKFSELKDYLSERKYELSNVHGSFDWMAFDLIYKPTADPADFSNIRLKLN